MSFYRLLNQANGSAAVEFAFVGPIMIATMLALFQGGMMVWTQLGLEHAVESAARCAAVNTSTCKDATTIQNYAKTQAYGLNVPATAFASSTVSCGVQVTASYTYYFLSRQFSAASVGLNAQACFLPQS